MNWADHNLHKQGNVVVVEPWRQFDWLTAGFTLASAGNMSYKFGDKDQVDKTRQVIGSTIVTMDQVHGDKIQVVESVDHNFLETDGMMTAKNDIVLAVLVADCVPLLFMDPVRRVVAVAHAGRRGTFAGIAKKMFCKISEHGSKVSDIQVVIGPSIGPCCYVFDDQPLDLWSLNEQQLRDSGATTIIRTDLCTKHTDYFFSHQRDPQAGRFAGFIGGLLPFLGPPGSTSDWQR